MALLYLECLQVLLETTFLPQEFSRAALTIAARFIAAGVLLGVEARSSIATTTLGAILSHLSAHIVVYKASGQFCNSITAVFVVFAVVTAYWMSMSSFASL